jgi:dUTPase
LESQLTYLVGSTSPCLLDGGSGLPGTIRKHLVMVHDAVVDSGYRGPMFVCMTNLSGRSITIEAGQRMAQMIPHRIEEVDWVPMKQQPPATQRGDRGFGSSGL